MTRIDHSKRNKRALPKEFITHQVFYKNRSYGYGRKPKANQKKNNSNQWNRRKYDHFVSTIRGMSGQPLFHQHYQKELANFFLKEKVTHFVTLAFNHTMALPVGRKILGYFLARLDKALLGRFWKKKTKQRVFAIAFPENIEYNTHYHAVFRVAPEHVAEFTANAERQWRKLVPSGDIDIQLIWDTEGLAEYMTKQASREPVIANMIISTEFHPR